MKVSQDRIPNPNPDHTANTQHSVGSRPGNYGSPYTAQASTSQSAPPPGMGSKDHSQAEVARAASLPLQARRRVKPSLEPNPELSQAEHESQDIYSDQDHWNVHPGHAAQLNPYTHQQRGPEYQDFVNYHDGHNYYGQAPSGASFAPASSVPPISQSPYGSNRSPNQSLGRATNGPAHAHSRSQTTTSQGPYQAVVVFLLLLMALVIMGIVYQLFFRPASSSDDALSNNSYAASEETPQVAEDNDDSTQAETLTESQTEQAQAETPAQNASGSPAQGQSGKPSYGSPISSVTPRGEVLARPPASVPQPPPPPTTIQNENELLLQSKVGGIGYWIQVGAFSSLGNANNIKQQLARHHLESVIQEGKNGAGKIYRVRVGLYASREETERILRQLKGFGKSFANSIIIKIEL